MSGFDWTIDLTKRPALVEQDGSESSPRTYSLDMKGSIAMSVERQPRRRKTSTRLRTIVRIVVRVDVAVLVMVAVVIMQR